MDAMKNSGIDIRKPGFEHILPHLKQLDKPDVLPVTGGEAIGKDPAYYIGNKIGVERGLFGEKVGAPSKSQGKSGNGPKVVSANPRYPGELKTITPLLEDTVKNLSQYYKAHKGLVDLVSRHKTDMTAGIKELMGMKQARTSWQNRRNSIIASGKPDPGEYKGLNIPGIKLKTGLYAYGMMGGSTSVVPDTHFIRHMFGLDTHKDSKTLKYLKNALWNPSNYHIIEKYNDWYRQHHPAHKWMANHKDFKHMFEKPEDATFPSFWANWMNIPAYEAKLGTSYGKQAHNAGSTHAPYWAAIAPHVNQALTRLGKSEDFDTMMPLRAALIMQHYVKDYGEVPAQLLYYQHLVPKLLECAKNRQDSADATSFLKKTLKLEETLIELRKDIRHVVEGGHSVEMPEVYRVNMHEGGKSYPAGRFMTSKGKLHHLEDYHGLLESMLPEGEINAQTVSRIHGLMASPHFDVQEHQLPKDEPEIDSKVANVPQVSVEKQPEPKRAGVFSYFRPGMSKPHVVEFGPNGAALDGKALSQDELALMLENSRKGLAQVKWGGSEDLAKREATEDLMGQSEALQHIRAAVLAGHIHPSVERALTKHIFEDPMVGNIGNKFAATEFRRSNKPGTYASIDLNDFKHVNDKFGHDQGDEAIKAAGGALRDASAKVGTTKIFRTGGDELTAWAPTFEHMSHFLGHARNHFDALPPVAGQHKLSFSVGVGNNFAKADEALGIAKQGKLDPVTKQRLHAPGQVPHLGHSLVIGQEGPLMQPDTKPPKMALSD
jgi:diguanylate cyclase (GGDEF)-like protein